MFVHVILMYTSAGIIGSNVTMSGGGRGRVSGYTVGWPKEERYNMKGNLETLDLLLIFDIKERFSALFACITFHFILFKYLCEMVKTVTKWIHCIRYLLSILYIGSDTSCYMYIIYPFMNRVQKMLYSKPLAGFMKLSGTSFPKTFYHMRRLFYLI